MSYPNQNRIYPRANRIYPLRRAEDAFQFYVGSVQQFAPLGRKMRPFERLAVPFSETVSTIEHKSPTAGGFTTLAVGSHSDIIEAARHIAWTPTDFSTGAVWTIRITNSDAEIRTETVTLVSDVRLPQQRVNAKVNQTVRPFASAQFADDAAQVTAVQYSISGQATVAKTAILRRTIATGTHDGSNNSATLEDSTADFDTIPVEVNDTASNDTDGSEATISAISGSTITGTLSGGTDDDWDTSDAYTLYAADDLIRRARDFEYKPASAGTYVVTLFVTDGSANEFSAVTTLEVVA